MSEIDVKQLFDDGPEAFEGEREKRFYEQYKSKFEELSDSEEATVNIVSDLEERNFDGEEEQYQSVETLKGMASNENDITEMFWEEFDTFISDFADKVQDEIEMDIDQPEVEESTQEASMDMLSPGDQVVFNDGEYAGFTGTIQKVGVGERFDHVSVEIHQEHPHGDTAFVTPDQVEKLAGGDQQSEPSGGDIDVDRVSVASTDHGSKFHKELHEADTEDTDDESK